jgi:hypothetical protein
MKTSNIEWNHFKVFMALVASGLPTKGLHLKSPYYVKIYPHELNAALLYDLSVSAPVHIHEQSVDVSIWEKMKPFLQKSGVRDPRGFYHYKVVDWNRFAASIGL